MRLIYSKTTKIFTHQLQAMRHYFYSLIRTPRKKIVKLVILPNYLICDVLLNPIF